MGARSPRVEASLPRAERLRLIVEHGLVGDVIAARVLELRAAIAERGGQRRARPYLDVQLRRLGLG